MGRNYRRNTDLETAKNRAFLVRQDLLMSEAVRLAWVRFLYRTEDWRSRQDRNLSVFSGLWEFLARLFYPVFTEIFTAHNVGTATAFCNSLSVFTRG